MFLNSNSLHLILKIITIMKFYKIITISHKNCKFNLRIYINQAISSERMRLHNKENSLQIC